MCGDYKIILRVDDSMSKNDYYLTKFIIMFDHCVDNIDLQVIFIIQRFKINDVFCIVFESFNL